MVLSFLRVRELQREIFGDRLINPLVLIGGPAHHVAPPLMRDFVERHDIGEKRAPRWAEARAILGFVWKEGKSGEIQKPGPALAERARNLRNVQIPERERAGVNFIEAD